MFEEVPGRVDFKVSSKGKINLCFLYLPAVWCIVWGGGGGKRVGEYDEYFEECRHLTSPKLISRARR